RAGDPGAGLGPDQYWAGSSLGQVYALVGREPEPEDRLAAAADHCLPAAYQGQCPGVDPDALLAWRVATRAAFQGRPVAALEAAVAAARQALRAAPRVDLGGVAVADLRDRPVPELPEAAMREGLPFLARVRDRDGREKTVLQAAPPEAVRAFQALAPQFGRGEAYGDPARGFAGVYATAAKPGQPRLW
ncbi:MAG: hypothetical protein OWV35_11185, partial [Firmicutes bacterium]|nr:hypothetical protein [Bacillota bacterium]